MIRGIYALQALHILNFCFHCLKKMGSALYALLSVVHRHQFSTVFEQILDFVYSVYCHLTLILMEMIDMVQFHYIFSVLCNNKLLKDLYNMAFGVKHKHKNRNGLGNVYTGLHSTDCAKSQWK